MSLLLSRVSIRALYLLIAAAPAWPQTADQLYQRAARAFEQRDLAAARRDFLRVVELSPPAPKSRYYLGRIAVLESHPSEAVRWLEPIAAADPAVFDTPALLGKAYFDSGQLEKARTMTERALRQSPWDGALHYRLARIYQQTGQPDAAQREFAESVRLKSEDRGSVQELLECSNYIARGDMEQALRIRSKLIENRSLDPDALVALGLSFAAAGKHQESLAPFEEAARRDPNMFQAQYNSGLALLKLDRAREAESPLEASVRLAPDSNDALSALSAAYVIDSRYADAVAPLEKWVRTQPDNSRAAIMLALAYLRTSQPSKAVSLIEKVTRESPSDPKPYFLLIEALNATEKQADALAAAGTVVRLFPDVARAHLARAQQLARVGRYGEAGPEFRRALELAPGQVDSLLGLAESQQKQGDYAASLATYRSALERDPGNMTATVGAARNLVLLHRQPEARELLESAAKSDPSNSDVHYELSRVYARLGERELAAEQMRIIEQLRTGDARPQ